MQGVKQPPQKMRFHAKKSGARQVTMRSAPETVKPTINEAVMSII